MTTPRSVLIGTAIVAGLTAAIRRRAPAPGAGGTPAPELTNTSWLNSDKPLRLAELRGRVVLLNFWVFTCGNCTRTVPSLVAYDRRYPQDNDRRTWDAYSIRYWPSFVLIDKAGTIRYTGYGEFHLDDGDYQEWDRRIQQLLAESPLTLDAGPPLRLVAAPGVRINARLKPALELDDGTVVRFDSPHVTADSAYFTAAPTAAPPLTGNRHGTLRLSVCPAGEKICRLVEMAVVW